MNDARRRRGEEAWAYESVGRVWSPRRAISFATPKMLLHDGAHGKTRIMTVDTARLATGNIHPLDVKDPTDGVGAGSRALLLAPIIPPGMVGAGGSAGTLFWIDQKRRGAVVFMSQAMYGNPARSPYQQRLFAAIDQGV